VKDTAVVILNYNGRHFLEKFLALTIERSQEAEVVIIDNASTDDSTDYVSTHFPNIHIIQLAENYGFARGYNEGLKKLTHANFVLLNSDVEVKEGWLAPLQAACIGDTVAVQPKIKSYASPEYFEYAGAGGGELDLFGFAFCRGRVFDTVEKDVGQFDAPAPLFWASGACFFVKSKAFWEVGGFDERFFAHMEEIDLCWRFHNRGYQIWYVPTSEVLHVGGGTLATGNPYKTYLNFRNNLAMMAKNLPARYVFPLLFMRLSLDGISGLRFLLQGAPSHLWAVLKSHFMFYWWMPYLLKNRSASALGYHKLYKGSVVWQYFVKGQKTYKEICSK
jgi:GT2 family glycosyltransferase